MKEQFWCDQLGKVLFTPQVLTLLLKILHGLDINTENHSVLNSDLPRKRILCDKVYKLPHYPDEDGCILQVEVERGHPETILRRSFDYTCELFHEHETRILPVIALLSRTIPQGYNFSMEIPFITNDSCPQFYTPYWILLPDQCHGSLIAQQHKDRIFAAPDHELFPIRLYLLDKSQAIQQVKELQTEFAIQSNQYPDHLLEQVNYVLYMKHELTQEEFRKLHWNQLSEVLQTLISVEPLQSWPQPSHPPLICFFLY